MVVSGSFNRLMLPKIKDAAARLQELGYTVLAPLFDRVEDVGGVFPVLDTDDRARSPRELERSYLTAIGHAALHVIVCRDDGRIGRSAAAEGAYAAAHDTARIVTTMSSSEEKPTIWFAEELLEEERAVLEGLPWENVNLYSTGVVPLLERGVEGAALSLLPEQRVALVGTYERLLSELSDMPLNQR